LKDAGAKEIHLRISSPPVSNPCFFGIDTPSKSQLIGAQKSVEEIREILQVDSLAYVSIDGLMKAAGTTNGFCKACFDGEYPMEVPRDLS
jgi:amidophosphoribosyltransferase